jgi:hypothetical protein
MLAELQVPNASPQSLTELRERAENIRQLGGTGPLLRANRDLRFLTGLLSQRKRCCVVTGPSGVDALRLPQC